MKVKYLILDAMITLAAVVVAGAYLIPRPTTQLTRDPVLGAPADTYQKNLIPVTDSTYTLGTTSLQWLNLYTDQICLNGDCKTDWPTGGTGGSGGLIWNSYASGTIVAPTNTAQDLAIGGQNASANFYIDAATGNSTSTGHLAVLNGNSDQWNLAYSWGDHSLAGYASSTGMYAKAGTLGELKTIVSSDFHNLGGTDATWLTTDEQNFWNTTSTWAGFAGQFNDTLNATTTLDLTTLQATNIKGTLTGNVTGALTGNADTATALANNPSDCTNQFAYQIAANGNLTCAAVTPTYMDMTADYTFTGLVTTSDLRATMINATSTNIDSLVSLNATSTHFGLTGFASCTALETNADGTVICGTDATGAGGDPGAWNVFGDPVNNIITPTSSGAGILVNAASSTITNLVVSDGLIVNATTTLNSDLVLQPNKTLWLNAPSTGTRYGLLFGSGHGTPVFAAYRDDTPTTFELNTIGKFTISANTGVTGGGSWSPSVGFNTDDTITMFASEFTLTGNTKIIGNATTSGYLVVGTANPTINMIPGDVLAGRATTTNLAVTGTKNAQFLATDANGTIVATSTMAGFAESFATLYNATTTQTNFKPNWDALHNATTTYPGAQTQFNNYLNATTTLDLNTLVVRSATTTHSLYVSGPEYIDAGLMIDDDGTYALVNSGSLIVGDGSDTGTVQVEDAPACIGDGGCTPSGTDGDLIVEHFTGLGIDNITPTSTLAIQGNMTTWGNATTTGYLIVGDLRPTWNMTAGSALMNQINIGTAAPTGAAWGAGDIWAQNDIMAGGIASSTSITVNGLFKVNSSGNATSTLFDVTNGSHGIRFKPGATTGTIEFY